MTGPAGAFALTGLEILDGTFFVLWGNMLVYPMVDRGHYRSATWVLFPLMAGIAFLLPSHSIVLGLAVAIFAALFLIAVYLQRPLLEKGLGAVALGLGVWTVLAAALSDCPGDCFGTGVHALAGSLMLGGVTHAMVLGHWYLNQPRLPIEPLKGAARLLLTATGASIGAGIATRSSLVEGAPVPGLLAFSASGWWWAWLLLQCGVLVLGFMVASTVRSRSTQSATGLLYVAIIPALVAQFILNLLVL